jgi:hypothetical protein
LLSVSGEANPSGTFAIELEFLESKQPFTLAFVEPRSPAGVVTHEVYARADLTSLLQPLLALPRLSEAN